MIRLAASGAAAAALAAVLSCASAPSASVAGPPCRGLTPPYLVANISVPLPPTYTAARLGADVIDEIVLDKTGAVKETRYVASAVAPLAPFAQSSLERSRYAPATIDGNPVAVRGVVIVPVGAVRPLPSAPPYDTLRVFVAAGASREALWQLAGSVERLTLVAHVGTDAARGGASIVAVAPGGAEKVLLAVPASTAAVEVRETVGTSRFFHDAGDYAVRLQAGGKVLASTTLTVATGFESAIVNACEPIQAPERTGPGK